jgi:predicted transcriptional regulator
MKRTTITLTDEIEEALENYQKAQDVNLSTTAITQAALREFLAQRGFLRTRRAFWLTPAEHGSGDPHASRDHNRSVAEAAEIR